MTHSKGRDRESKGTNFCMARAALVGTMILIFAATPLHGQTLTVLHNFTNGGDGGSPSAGLTMDHAGNFYGTAMSGGEGNSGTVFKLSRAGSGWVLATLYSFRGGDDGAYPQARVVFGPDGTLYGTTTGGGGGRETFTERHSKEDRTTAELSSNSRARVRDGRKACFTTSAAWMTGVIRTAA